MLVQNNIKSHRNRGQKPSGIQMSEIEQKPRTSKLEVVTMGVPEIKGETNVCAVKGQGVNEETKPLLVSLGMKGSI